jgi:hypothetical protein
MLGKLFAFALASIAVSLAATWLVPMVRQQKANGIFDRFMKHDELEPTTDVVEPKDDKLEPKRGKVEPITPVTTA